MTGTATLSPTGLTQRINSVDVVRGVALLGILLMNINGFGLFWAYNDPTITGGSTGWNLRVWWIANMFFEGTMRGMFSMVFGAGVILFTSRSSPAISSDSVTDAYFRRILWLVLFGIIHNYLLLWDGEFLYANALLGLFVFSFRHMKPRHLILISLLWFSCSTALNVKEYFQAKDTYELAEKAALRKRSGARLSKEEAKHIETWKEVVASEKPDAAKIKTNIEARHKGYWSIVWFKAPITQFMQTTFMYRFFFFDVFAMMLLGMAFLKNGILKAEKSLGFYARMALIGYAIGLTTNYLETSWIMSHQFDVLSFKLASISYDFGRVFTTIGQVGLIMLFIKWGGIGFLQKWLAAVGRMAFTNYIMQTLICITIFMGFGFGLYGRLQRYELYYVVLGVWIFQLILSPIWLSYFRFGPLEWAWRSLTYWQRQPFRKSKQEI